MILVFGFRTPASTEIPTILYLGADADEMNRIIEKSAFPRIAFVTNPTLRQVKHWSEEASETFEKSKAAKKLDEPIVANVHPHLEPGAIVYGSEGYRLNMKLFVHVPKAKDLTALGYSEADAATIIARQQAMADAFDQDDTLSQLDLATIADTVAPAPAVPPLPVQAAEESDNTTAPKDDDDELDTFTVPDLKDFAAGNDIDTTGAKAKKDYLEIIRMFMSLKSANTVNEIKALAAKEGVVPEGLKVKADFLNAIVAQRRAKAVQ